MYDKIKSQQHFIWFKNEILTQQKYMLLQKLLVNGCTKYINLIEYFTEAVWKQYNSALTQNVYNIMTETKWRQEP